MFLNTAPNRIRRPDRDFKSEFKKTGLLKMTVGVLTTCHTQYT